VQSSQVKGVSCLIDTDIAIDFLRRRDYAQKLLAQWAVEGLLAISTLTHLEIYQGMKAGEEKATNSFLEGVVSVVGDIPIARYDARRTSLKGENDRYRRCYYRRDGFTVWRSATHKQY